MNQFSWSSMAVKMHIYSAATFFLDFDAFAATFRFFENPEILAAHLDLPQLFFFKYHKVGSLFPVNCPGHQGYG
jgi:hypothetical protein